MHGKVAALAALLLVAANSWANADLIAQDQRLVEEFTPRVMEQVLNDLNIKLADEEGSYVWEEGDFSFSLSPIEDEDGNMSELFMSATIEKGLESESDAHDWNVASRFGRVYAIDETVYVEHDLIARGGVTVGSIKKAVTRFQKTAAEVKSFLWGEE
ncbi:MAG: YbjN domain-containing protein [Fimbriimonadaceae bacterium]|nr:YbjN domain-containing protein [Fimbriimonadaceae bacterium]